jgi:hypothetical protein
MCDGEVLFWSWLFGVLEAFFIWMSISFLKFGMFFDFIFIEYKIKSYALTCTFSPSSMPMTHKFVLFSPPKKQC